VFGVQEVAQKHSLIRSQENSLELRQARLRFRAAHTGHKGKLTPEIMAYKNLSQNSSHLSMRR
jgi:hypothetical protein